MIPVPQQYVIETFYRCVSQPSYNKYSDTYNGSCPFCKEGKSFGTKTRFFYIPKKELCYCHNCGYSKKVFSFLLDVTGKPFNEIINDIKKLDNTVVPVLKEETVEKVHTPSLPDDCINLFDENQLKFHKSNAIVSICLDTIKKRRLDTAINRPRTFYLSLTDKVHKNRLVLPFYDVNGDIIYYQTRTLLPADDKIRPRYLSKVGSERSLYGVHNIDPQLEHVFIFEGPIDSYFIKNGLAVCGIAEDSSRTFTEQQQQQINHLSYYKKVWCLDNQWNDNASLKKSTILADKGDLVFIWPEDLKNCKDVNEYCVNNKVNKINPEFVLQNTYSGLKAKILLTNIKNKRN